MVECNDGAIFCSVFTETDLNRIEFCSRQVCEVKDGTEALVAQGTCTGNVDSGQITCLMHQGLTKYLLPFRKKTYVD